MEPVVSFFGAKIPQKQKVEVVADYGEDDFETIHLTQAALGPNPSKGAHTVMVEDENGNEFALGTLEKDKCPHFSIDITLATESIKVYHSGSSEVHLTGYRTISIAGFDEDDLDGYDLPSPTSSEEEEEEEEDDEEAPRAVALARNAFENKLMVEEHSSDEDESSEEPSSGAEDGSSSEEESSDEGEGSEEEESSDEEQPVMPQPKRKQHALQTPQPTKKPKAALDQAPKTAPPKVVSATEDENRYVSLIKAHLQQKGPTKLAILGSSVQRPKSCPKLKVVISKHSKLLKYDPSTDMVSLNKK